MQIQEAKSYVGARVNLTWVDRKGEEIGAAVEVFKVDFLPLYGPCMQTDAGDIRLDRIVSCRAAAPAISKNAA